MVRWLLSLSILYSTSAVGQEGMNGSYELRSKSEIPQPWTIMSTAGYGAEIDSTISFDGCNSLHIMPTNTCTEFDSQVIFQKLTIREFTSGTTFSLKYMVKVVKSDSSLNYISPYVNLFVCAGRAQADKSIKISIDNNQKTVSPAYGDWKSYTVTGRLLDVRCLELYVGFVVNGITDLYVDHVNLVVDH